MNGKSYEELMERKLAQVSDRRDRRQGSLVFDAMGPNAAETAAFYADLDMLEDRTFADTAQGDDLARRCAERGVVRKGAVKATFYGRFLDGEGKEYPVAPGTRFFLEKYYYRVLSRDEDGRYVLECETPGACGNEYLSNLLPLEHMDGLAEAALEELRTDGEDEEGDEELRKRYYASFDADAFGGNIPDYRRKVGALENVGGVKVYPVWNGGGTVRLVVIDQGWKKPTAVELERLQALIDPEKRGEGYGIAPIGHKVTVAGVEERVCDITMRLVMAEGGDAAAAQAEIREQYEEYMAGLRKAWADSGRLTVRISHLEARALEAEGVLDVQDCEINGTGGNIVLGEDEIPVLGEIGVTL